MYATSRVWPWSTCREWKVREEKVRDGKKGEGSKGRGWKGRVKGKERKGSSVPIQFYMCRRPWSPLNNSGPIGHILLATGLVWHVVFLAYISSLFSLYVYIDRKCLSRFQSWKCQHRRQPGNMSDEDRGKLHHGWHLYAVINGAVGLSITWECVKGEKITPTDGRLCQSNTGHHR